MDPTRSSQCRQVLCEAKILGIFGLVGGCGRFPSLTGLPESPKSFLDTVSTGSSSDLVQSSERQTDYFLTIFESCRLTRSLPLPVLTVSNNEFLLFEGRTNP
jgi:hypothetical protein